MPKLIEYIHDEQDDIFILFDEKAEHEFPVPQVEKWMKENGCFNWSEENYQQEINDVKQSEGSYKTISEYLHHNSPITILQDLNSFFSANVSA